MTRWTAQKGTATDNRRLFLLCGYPYAGKSTLARWLHTQLGWSLVAMDAINTEFGRGIAGAAITPAQWEATYQEAFSRIGALLSAGETVLYDAPNFTRAERDTLRRLADAVDVRCRIIFVTTSEAVARERWLANRQHPIRSDVRDEDFQQVIDLFEPPTPDEDVLLFDGLMTPEEWLSWHLDLMN